MRPIVSSSTTEASERRPASRPSTSGPRRATTAPGVRVRRLERAADDGYRSGLVPGLRASADAQRLAEEIARATGRLGRLAAAPPGLYADVASTGSDVEERAWLAFLIAYLCPLQGDDPFSGIRAVRTTWVSGEMPDLDGVETGPRTAHDVARGSATLGAYRAWAERAGSQAQALTGEGSWTAERRFQRVFERLALPGLLRDARFDLLVTLGRLGVFELSAGSLELGGSDGVTVAAKRALGIGDPLLLERRAAALAEACGVPLEALDLGFYNWDRPPEERATLGMGADAEPDPAALDSARAALGL
jgi:hypothetical protein